MKPDIYAADHPELIGAHYDMSNSDYHSTPAVSKSTLSLVDKSINHWLYHKRKETPQMLLGSAAHAKLLEPASFNDEFIVGPNRSRSTNEWKDFVEANPGKSVIHPKEMIRIMKMTAAVQTHPTANDLIFESGAKPEVSVFGEDDDTGILVRVRPDQILEDDGLIIDLKTTADASAGWGGFPSSVRKFQYHVQHALYVDFCQKHYGRPFTFVFVAVETGDPFGVAVYTLDDDMVNRGREIYRSALDRVHDYAQNGGGTGYAEEIMTINAKGVG